MSIQYHNWLCCLIMPKCLLKQYSVLKQLILNYPTYLERGKVIILLHLSTTDYIKQLQIIERARIYLWEEDGWNVVDFLTFIYQMIKRNNISTSTKGPTAALQISKPKILTTWERSSTYVKTTKQRQQKGVKKKKVTFITTKPISGLSSQHLYSLCNLAAWKKLQLCTQYNNCVSGC